MAVLKARDLTLQYDQRRVVEGLTAEIPEGRVTMIVGANACGKSTLLRGLSRLLKPAAGTVTLDGKDGNTWEQLLASERAARLGT